MQAVKIRAFIASITSTNKKYVHIFRGMPVFTVKLFCTYKSNRNNLQIYKSIEHYLLFPIIKNGY